MKTITNHLCVTFQRYFLLTALVLVAANLAAQSTQPFRHFMEIGGNADARTRDALGEKYNVLDHCSIFSLSADSRPCVLQDYSQREADTHFSPYFRYGVTWRDRHELLAEVNSRVYTFRDYRGLNGSEEDPRIAHILVAEGRGRWTQTFLRYHLYLSAPHRLVRFYVGAGVGYTFKSGFVPTNDLQSRFNQGPLVYSLTPLGITVGRGANAASVEVGTPYTVRLGYRRYL